MAHFEISTNIPCINHCAFCPQPKLKAAYVGETRLSFNRFKEALAKVPKNISIHFSGYSECFGNKESSLMMKYAYEQGYEVMLYTTLIGFSRADDEILQDVKFGHIDIHAPDDTNFVTNEKHFIEAYKLFSQTHTPNIIAYHIGNLTPAVNELIGHLPYVTKGAAITSRANNDEAGVVRKEERKEGRLMCTVGIYDDFVLVPNGNCYVCCQDYSLKHCCGNIFTGTWEDLLNSEERKMFLEGTHETICRYCDRSKIVN